MCITLVSRGAGCTSGPVSPGTEAPATQFLQLRPGQRVHAFITLDVGAQPPNRCVGGGIPVEHLDLVLSLRLRPPNPCSVPRRGIPQ